MSGYQLVDAVEGFGVVMVFLIEQRQTEARLKVTRHQREQVLIVEACEVVAAEAVVAVSTVIECRNVGRVDAQHLVVFTLGRSPLLQLHIPPRFPKA